MSKRDWSLLIGDMLESMDRTASYIQGIEWEGFMAGARTQDAVVRNLEILGEAANLLPPELRDRAPDVDWRGVIGLRNRLIHEYFGVSPSVVWQIVSVELPVLGRQLRSLQC